jgi:putative endonuclease
MWYLYILLCEDKSLYTGITNNLEKRLSDHKRGVASKYTRSHKVVRLIYQESLESHSAALKRELEIKGWSRVKKIKTFDLLNK